MVLPGTASEASHEGWVKEGQRLTGRGLEAVLTVRLWLLANRVACDALCGVDVVSLPKQLAAVVVVGVVETTVVEEEAALLHPLSPRQQLNESSQYRTVH